MIKKLIEWVINIFYGKPLILTKDDLILFAAVILTLDNIMQWKDTIILTETDKWMWDDLLPNHRFVNKENKPIVPKIYYNFVKKGRSLSEIDDYIVVKRYGMLHGKSRRLVVVGV